MKESTTLPDAYEEALKLHRYYQSLYQEILQNGPDAEQNVQILLTAVKPGLYEHFKSTQEKPMRYAVFWVARQVDDGSFFVNYAPLYLPRFGDQTLRRLLSPIGETDPQKCDGFLDPIDRASYRGPRFSLIEERTHAELVTIVSKSTEVARVLL
jgi:hypothetical protein